jgi:hypothetical protein
VLEQLLTERFAVLKSLLRAEVAELAAQRLSHEIAAQVDPVTGAVPTKNLIVLLRKLGRLNAKATRALLVLCRLSAGERQRRHRGGRAGRRPGGLGQPDLTKQSQADGRPVVRRFGRPVPKYARDANPDRLVRILCKGRCSERGRRTHLSWAAVQQPFPDPEVIRWATIRRHLHDYTAECLRCGSLARDPYGWLWPRTPRHREGVSDLVKRLTAMTSGAMSMSLTKQSHRKEVTSRLGRWDLGGSATDHRRTFSLRPRTAGAPWSRSCR